MVNLNRGAKDAPNDDDSFKNRVKYHHELSETEEARLERLFNKLDKNHDGKIDICEMSKALKESGISEKYAHKFLEQSDKTDSGDIGLAEFIHYVREHEKHLKLQFSHMDKNRDGKVDLEEMISAFKDLGVDIEKREALKLLQRMDQDGSLNISFDEWRDFLLLAPSTDLHELISYWRHSTIDLSPNSANNYYKNLIAGTRPLRAPSHFYDDQAIERLTSTVTVALHYVTHLLEARGNLSRVELIEPTEEDVPDHLLMDGKYLDIGEDLNVPDDFTQSEMQTGMWWRHLAAGGVAGCVSRSCTAPLDRLKVFLQVQATKQRISDCFKYMLKEGGFKSLWRGNGINVLKIAPESALKFAAYEHIKRLIRGNDKRQMTIYERFVAGACAGAVSQTAIYPLEVLKTRLALRKTGQYKGMFDAGRKIYHTEGLRSFYRGYIPNILGILPYAGIDLAVYETLKKKYLSHHKETEQPTIWLLLACGSASSTLGQVCSYPLALVRTRLQAQAIAQTPAPNMNLNVAGFQNVMYGGDGQKGVPQTMSSTFRRIIQQEGFAGLYRGITPNFIKVLPAVSISYVVYEYSSRALGVNMT